MATPVPHPGFAERWPFWLRGGATFPRMNYSSEGPIVRGLTMTEYELLVRIVLFCDKGAVICFWQKTTRKGV